MYLTLHSVFLRRPVCTSSAHEETCLYLIGMYNLTLIHSHSQKLIFYVLFNSRDMQEAFKFQVNSFSYPLTLKFYEGYVAWI